MSELTSTIGGNMLLVSSVWEEYPTFKLIPATENCPFVEGLYDPKNEVLVFISKTIKTSMHMLPKLDDNGDPMRAKAKRPNGKDYREKGKAPADPVVEATVETGTEVKMEVVK